MTQPLTCDMILSISKDRLQSTNILTLKGLISFVCLYLRTLDRLSSVPIFLIIFNSLEKAPNIGDLLKLMSDMISWWYIIGVRLGIKNGELDSLFYSNQRNIVKLSKVLQLWMEQTTKPVTWNTILEVIGSPPIKNKAVVMEIEKFLQCEYLYNIPRNAE